MGPRIIFLDVTFVGPTIVKMDLNGSGAHGRGIGTIYLGPGRPGRMNVGPSPAASLQLMQSIQIKIYMQSPRDIDNGD